MTIYDIGDKVRVTASFTNLDGDAADPTTVTVKVQPPGGTITSYVHGTDDEVEKDATGVYHIDLSTDRPGRWRYRWETTGLVEAAEDGHFDVRNSDLA